MKMGIYGILNTANGKWYVGQSCNLDIRRYNHLAKLRRGKHFNRHLQSAFTNYGEDIFEWHTLEEVSENMLDVREIAWIEYYQSNNGKYGYNCDSGGCVNRHYSEESKRRMSESHKNPSIEVRKRMSDAHVGKMSNRLGCHISEEQRRKLLEANRGRVQSLGEKLKKSQALKGKPWSDKRRKAHAVDGIRALEINLKKSQALKGKPWTETRRNAQVKR